MERTGKYAGDVWEKIWENIWEASIGGKIWKHDENIWTIPACLQLGTMGTINILAGKYGKHIIVRTILKQFIDVYSRAWLGQNFDPINKDWEYMGGLQCIVCIVDGDAVMQSERF